MGQVSTFCNGADTCLEVDETEDGLIKITAYQGADEPRRAIYATKGEFRAFLAGAKAGEFDAFTQGSEKDPEMGVLPTPIKARA